MHQILKIAVAASALLAGLGLCAMPGSGALAAEPAPPVSAIAAATGASSGPATPVSGNPDDLDEKRLAHPARIDFATLPLRHAIKTVRGNGARKLAIFSDPDCPYCKRLERDTLSKLDNVTIYTFLFPLDQHTDAQRKSWLIWCAPDRAKAWQDWMQRGALPAQDVCMPPLAANRALGKKLGVRVTPTLVLPQGDIIMGAVDLDTLEMKLEP